MPDILQKNLDALKNYNPGIAAELGALSGAPGEPVLIFKGGKTSGKTSDGGPVTLVSYAGLGQTENVPSFCVIRGFGDGSLARVVLKAPGCEYVLVYEPQIEALLAVLSQIDLTAWLGDARLRLVTGDTEAPLRSAISRYFYEDSYRLTHVFRYATLTHQGTELLPGRNKFYPLFDRLLIAEIQAKLDRLKPNEEDAFWGFLNVLDNYPEFLRWPRLDSLRAKFSGKTGIVVASGPSLTPVLHLLKERAGDCAVFTCDASLKTLLTAGITPDFVGCLERIGATRRFFEGLPLDLKAPLIAPSVVGKSVLDLYPGPKIALFLEQGFDGWFAGGLTTDDIGNSPSVSHLGYLVLRRLGCERILLLGQDLCYDPVDGSSHETAAAEVLGSLGKTGRDIAGAKLNIIEVRGYDGGMRKTTPVWKHFAELFYPLIQRYGGKVWHVIPEDRGIPIQGTTQMAPATALKRDTWTKPDKSGLTALPVVEPGAADNFRARGKTWRETLRHWHARVLTEMRRLGETWRDFDPRGTDRGHGEIYARLFGELEAFLRELQDIPEWKGGFGKLLANSFLGLRVERQRIFNGKDDEVGKTYEMIQNYYKTLNLIQIWSSRVAEAMEHHAARWGV